MLNALWTSTFLSFSPQTLTLAKDNQWFNASANVLLSLVVFLTALWLGNAPTSTSTQRKAIDMHLPHDAMLSEVETSPAI
jgi:hypothetical protein